MKRAIFRRCVLITLISLLVSAAISALILNTMRKNEINANMQLTLTAVKSQIEYDIAHNLFLPQDEVKKYSNYRLSIIDGTGRVLADSSADSRTMANHADRPEFIEAQKNGSGSAVRQSDTLNRMMTYAALKVNDNLYIRLAMENEYAQMIYKSLIPAVLIGLLIAGLLAPVIAASVSRGITDPLIRARNQIEGIASGGEVMMLPSPQYEELIPIVDSVNTLSMRISDALGQLQNERERTKTLLDNMEEGLAIIDSRLRVVSVNRAAERYLGGMNAQGRNIVYLTREGRILESVEAAVRCGRSTILDIANHAQGGILSAHVTPARGSMVISGGGREENGAILLLTDVTTIRENEKMRSEFVANASHELKTPITSIKGFAELLASGIVQDTDTANDYLNRITAEATRMTRLIDDIIKLSEMESGRRVPTAEAVNLTALARELAESLAPIALQKGVALTVTGEDVSLTAQREDMRQILANLMDNAVKYNKKGGTVKVECIKDEDSVRVTVADTGIGIARVHHARVFERFYCVDKGRSRTVGGTGLGLSIVKHAAARWGGEILFESAEGKGTTVTVVFQMPNRSSQERTE